MLRWSGQNANQKVGPDKMPTMEKKARTKCQPRLAFRPVGILSGWHLVLPPCRIVVAESWTEIQMIMCNAHYSVIDLDTGQQLLAVESMP